MSRYPRNLKMSPAILQTSSTFDTTETKKLISPNLKPPSRDLPSKGCLVKVVTCPWALECSLSDTICFNR